MKAVPPSPDQAAAGRGVRTAAATRSPLVVMGIALLGALLPLTAQALFESAPTHALDLSPDGRTLALAHTVAGEVWLLDLPEQGPPTTRARVVVGIDPVAVRYCADGSLWVVNAISRSLNRIDPQQARVTHSMDLGHAPADLLCSADSSTLYVSQPDRNALAVIAVRPHLEPLPSLALGLQSPRALAWTDAGQIVVGAFESGNRSTILAGSVADPAIVFPPNVVSDPDGPWGGVNPPPNAGDGFQPPLADGLPMPPPVSLIVQQDADGRWRDDNGGDWSAFVEGEHAARSGRVPGWTLLDRDIAVVDPRTRTVRHVGGLMHQVMALAVTDDALLAVGSEAHNRIRFEPNLRARFADTVLARVALDSDNELTPQPHSLNPQLPTDRTRRIPAATRQLGFADPRALLAVPALQRVYAVGQGSHTLIELDPHGLRKQPQRQLELADGPVALAWSARTRRIYAWSQFQPTLSVIDPRRWRVEHRVPLPDPVPTSVRAGQRVLFSSRDFSATGHLACASCHVDARTDRLAWDLGNPAGAMQTFDQFCQTAQAQPCGDWHPMKGPMLTQTLFDIVGKEPLHWRGDRPDVQGFAGTFVSLLGLDRPPPAAALADLRSYLAVLRLPPNPYRDADNALPEQIDLGPLEAGPDEVPQPVFGDPRRGLQLFTTETRATPFRCASCHTLPSGAGTDRVTASSARPLPRTPAGPAHLGIASVSGLTQTLKIPPLPLLQQRAGFRTEASPSLNGFGYGHDGSVPTLRAFLAFRRFDLALPADQNDMLAFLLAFTGDDLPYPDRRPPLVLPVGPSTRASPAQLGRQWVGRLQTEGPAAALRLREAAVQAGLDLRASQGAKLWWWDATLQQWRDGEAHTHAWAAIGDPAAPLLLQTLLREPDATGRAPPPTP